MIASLISHPIREPSEQLWLRRVLSILTLATAILSVALLGVFLVLHHFAWLLLALLFLGVTASHFAALALIRQDRMRLALLQHNAVVGAICIVLALLVPSALPLLLMVPTLNVALALPHLGVRLLRALIGAAMLATALEVTLARWVLLEVPVARIGFMPMLLLALAEVGFIFWYLWHYRASFRRLQLATRAAHWALRSEHPATVQTPRTPAVAFCEAAIPYRTILDLTTDYLYSMRIDASGRVRIEWLSEHLVSVTGYGIDAIERAGGWEQIIHPDDRYIERDRRADLLEGKPNMREYRVITRQGEVLWLRDYRWPGPVGGASLVLSCAAQDITAQHHAAEQVQAMNRQLTERVAELQAAQEQLRALSTRDALTGLFNRRYMEEAFAREVSRAARQNYSIGVIMLDIDQFKQFNDTFGHAGGDVLLREIGRFLHNHVRSSDIACRYGGEEFIILMPDTSLETLLERAELLRRSAMHLRPDFMGSALGPVTISVGVAMLPDHGTTADETIHAADQALYRSKRAGRNRVTLAEGGEQSRAFAK